MSTLSRSISNVMYKNGFSIARQNKHQIWKDEDGNQMVTPTSPSDQRVIKHVMSQIKKLKSLKEKL